MKQSSFRVQARWWRTQAWQVFRRRPWWVAVTLTLLWELGNDRYRWTSQANRALDEWAIPIISNVGRGMMRFLAVPGLLVGGTVVVLLVVAFFDSRRFEYETISIAVPDLAPVNPERDSPPHESQAKPRPDIRRVPRHVSYVVTPLTDCVNDRVTTGTDLLAELRKQNDGGAPAGLITDVEEWLAGTRDDLFDLDPQLVGRNGFYARNFDDLGVDPFKSGPRLALEWGIGTLRTMLPS